MNRESQFDEIFRTYYNKLYQFVHQYVNEEEDCRDIVSTTFEEVWRHFDDVNPDTLQPYLYQSARNRLIDYLRKKDKRTRYLDYAVHMSQRYISDTHYEDEERNDHIIRHVLRLLGEPTGSILRACYLDGKKYKDVAEEMGTSVANVKKHMVKALKSIREIKKNIKV